MAIAAIVLLAAWLRVPYVTRGLPYFYEMDEAHHFQRTVQMVKEGSFDPKYFNKPSLHFYLRMPVVAVSFIVAARAGEIRRVDELATRKLGDTGGWAFTASHPRIAVWSRAFGVYLPVMRIVRPPCDRTAARAASAPSTARVGGTAIAG